MRFGFTTAPANCTWSELAAVWDAAEQLEVFDTGWTYDHFYPLRSGPEDPALEGWMCLAMLLARTTRLRGGVMVTGVPYRHPAVLAKMATTLDQASNGRLELGLGAGWFEPECEAYGISLGTMGERFDRFDEALQVIRSLLTQPTTDFDGRFYHLRDARCEPKAVQAPHPPIVMGGKGRQRFLPLVARFADHWNYSGDSLSEFVELRNRLTELCDERAFSDITVSANVRLSPEDPAATAAEAARYVDAGAAMVCVMLPRPYAARVMEPIATELVRLGVGSC